jgi:hypothetical protein
VIYDIEWSLQHLENLAAPILRDLAARWPLEPDDRAVLAALFAYQTVRGPRWKEWHEEFSRNAVEDYRRLLLNGSEADRDLPAQLDATENHVLSSSYRHTKMLNIAPKVASYIGSMQWNLIEFARPCVATSDHPVVAWHLNDWSRAPEPTPMGLGFSELLELRVPVSAERTIVMTWRDAQDTDPFSGKRQHAANLNAFTVAHAERQWFHHPAGSPPLVGGRLMPISPELARGYTASEARSSERRAEIIKRVQPRIGDPSLEQGFEIVFVS